MASNSKVQPTTCSMCLAPFKKPKFLPCFHSFCEQCLQDLITRHEGRKFPCPNCRKTVKVPREGVNGFQDNFYLDLEVQEYLQQQKDRKRVNCSTHPKNELISFCFTCERAICVECMLGEHKLHVLDTLANVGTRARQYLEGDQGRLHRILGRFAEKEREAREKREIVADAVESVRAEIHCKFAQIVSLAEKHRDEELARLEEVAKTLDPSSINAGVLAELKDKETTVLKMQEDITETLEHGSDLELILLAKEMRFGYGSEETLQAMVPKDWPMPVSALPVLNTRFSLDADIGLIQSVVGNVTTRDAAHVQPGVHSLLDKIRSALMLSS